MSDNPDTYPNAGRDSGYVAPVGEDLVNRLTELLAALETKLLRSNLDLTSRIDAHTERLNAQSVIQDQRFGYNLSQIGAFIEKEDTRHDVWDAELAKILAVTEETARGLEKHDREIEALLTTQNQHTVRLDVFETQLRDLRGPEMSPEQRQRYITILMRMIADWEAAHPDDAV